MISFKRVSVGLVGGAFLATMLMYVNAMGAKPTTVITPDQLRILMPSDSMELSKVKLLAFTDVNSGFGFYEVAIGTNVALVYNPTTKVMSITSTAAAPPVVVSYPDLFVTAARQSDGSYLMGKAPGTKVVQVVRNGLVQISPGDYVTNSNVIVPSSPWAADDTVHVNLFPIQ